MDLQLSINTEQETHQCIQENRGDEIWMYCPVCKVYVRKFDSNFKSVKLADTGFNHSGSILESQVNMN